MKPTTPLRPTVSLARCRIMQWTLSRKNRGRSPLIRTVQRPPLARRGSTWLRFLRRPHSTPPRQWRRSTTTAEKTGRQRPKTRSVCGCTLPSWAEDCRWHDPCPPTFQPEVVARYSDAEYLIPSFRGPRCSARTRHSHAGGNRCLRGSVGRPDVVRETLMFKITFANRSREIDRSRIWRIQVSL